MEKLIYKAILFIIKNNESNSLPYHGIDHLYEVYEFTKNLTTQSEYKNNITHKNELLIAALFHDYDHSGGKLSDRENIISALIGCKEFIDSVDDELDMDIIFDIIRATEFPTKLKSEDLTVEQEIIQDADMCYLFKDLSIVKLYSGLKDEMNIPLDEFLENQTDFFNNLKFNSYMCKSLWEEVCKEYRINELEIFIEIQNG